MRLIGRPWLPPSSRPAYWTARPWEEWRDLLGEIEYGEMVGGLMYYAAGTKRAQA